MSLLSLKTNPLLHLKAGAKYLLSFTTTDWQLTDYPIRFRHFNVTDTSGRLKQFPWSAQIINWWQIGGFGDTKQEAYADLQKRFAEVKSNRKTLPRPGTGLPIEFASKDRIRSFDDTADDFFRRVLEMNYYECFTSLIWMTGTLSKIFERLENRQ
jgi:hypothetical protein